ncbi:IS3 family transposase [Tissierella praeacuta]|uniref:IS3 family transposase n=1 Tax=Tissierella praeacuta TaxID=43131 RepID=UPI003A523408
MFHSDRGYQYTSKAFKKFCTYSELESAVIEYINYYNNHRYQKRLQCMTPIEYRGYLLDSAA